MTDPLPPDEIARLRAFYAERVQGQDAERPGYAADWARLRDVILRNGGVEVVPPPEGEALLVLLCEEGAAHDHAVVEVPGEVSDCHRNSARLWLECMATAIGSGYALSRDGLWREHSWAWRNDGALLETTEARLKYFGVRFESDRADRFAAWVLDDSDE